MSLRANNRHQRPSLPYFQSSPTPAYNNHPYGGYGFPMPQQPYVATPDYGYPQSYHHLVSPGLQMMDPMGWNQTQSEIFPLSRCLSYRKLSLLLLTFSGPMPYNRAYTPSPSYHHPENVGYFPNTATPKWHVPNYGQQNHGRGHRNGSNRNSVKCRRDLNGLYQSPAGSDTSDISDETRAAAEANARVELDKWADGLKDSVLNMMIKMSGNPIKGSEKNVKTPADDTESDDEVMIDV